MADPKDTVPFIRDKRYIDKNLAPERIPTMSVQALANQARLAVASGILRKDVAEYMLPNLMIEGRANDYGVNDVDILELPKKVRETLGLDEDIKAGKINVMAYSEKDGKPHRVYAKETYPLGTINFNATSHNNQDAAAKLKVAALANKQATAKRIYGEAATAEQVIGLWNGTGADSRRHVSRVVAAAGLLSNPRNQQIKGIWDAVMSPTPPTTASSGVSSKNREEDPTNINTLSPYNPDTFTPEEN